MLAVTQSCGFTADDTLIQLVQQGSATSLLATVTAPANIQQGDLLVLFDSAGQVGVNVPTIVPTGFTSINNVSITDGFSFIRSICSYKVAVGNESSSSISGMSGANSNDKMLLHFRPNVPINALTVGDVDGSGITTNPAAQTVTSASGVPPLIVFGAYSADAAVSPRTFTVGGSAAKDGEINSSTFAYLAWKIYNSAPADVVIDMDDEGAMNTLQSFYISVSG